LGMRTDSEEERHRSSRVARGMTIGSSIRLLKGFSRKTVAEAALMKHMERPYYFALLHVFGEEQKQLVRTVMEFMFAKDLHLSAASFVHAEDEVVFLVNFNDENAFENCDPSGMTPPPETDPAFFEYEVAFRDLWNLISWDVDENFTSLENFKEKYPSAAAALELSIMISPLPDVLSREEFQNAFMNEVTGIGDTANIRFTIEIIREAMELDEQEALQLNVPNQEFTVGEYVRCRDYSEWMEGFVSSLSPLKVLVNGWTQPHAFKCVESLEADMALPPVIPDMIEDILSEKVDPRALDMLSAPSPTIRSPDTIRLERFPRRWLDLSSKGITPPRDDQPLN